jgi:hypothetical protein
MNKESKFAKAMMQISNICVFVLPIITIVYFLWFQGATGAFILLEYYRIILYSCNVILWIGFFFASAFLLVRKRVVIGIILFLITAPCLSVSTLGLIGESPSPVFFRDLPQIYDHTQLGNKTYYLTSESGDWGLRYLYLYECGQQIFYCEQVFLGINHFGGHLIANMSNNEVNIVNDEGDLFYTYGEPSRSYVNFSKTQLENHLYYLSEGCAEPSGDTCNIYTYTLYECTLNNISCKSVPFEFEINHEVDLYL